MEVFRGRKCECGGMEGTKGVMMATCGRRDET